MAPRKLSDEQLEEIRLMLETFTAGLQAALQTSVTTALQTALHENRIQQAAQGANPQNQRNQQEAREEESDDEGLAENVFAEHTINQQGRRGDNNNDHRNAHGAEHDKRPIQNRWETSFRSELPEFHGTLNPEDFIDWVNIVEEIMDFRQVPDDVRVSLVATRFKGRAMAWWQQLKESRRQDNKPRITTWERLTKHMRRAFLPFNYERTLYNKLPNLRQGTRTVDEYATEFFYMTARMTSGETEKKLISRFIGGLRGQLQVALAQFNPTSVSEAHQRAISMESQLRPSWNSNSQTRFNHSSDNATTTPTDGASTRTEPAKTGQNSDTIANSRPARTNALRCFTCGERGHIQTACPKQVKRGLVIQEGDEEEPVYDNYDTEHDETTDELHGDTGLSLVLRRYCLLPRAPQESWLRSNLFRSTCTINGR